MVEPPLAPRRRRWRGRFNRLKSGSAKSGKRIFRLVKQLWDAPVGFQLGTLEYRSTVGKITVGWLAFQFTPQIVHVASVVFG